MSDSVKDVLALVIGTVLVMLVWVAIEGGTSRPSPGTRIDARSISSQPASATAIASATLSPQMGEGVLEVAYASLLPTFWVAAMKTIVQ